MTRAAAVFAFVVLGSGVGPVVDSVRAQPPGPASGPTEAGPRPAVERVPGDLGSVIDSLPPAKDFDGPALYQKCVRSTVFIVTPLKGGMAMGSGTLIDAEKRYVLTNYHVVDEVDQVFVQFPVREKDGSLMTDKKTYIGRIPTGAALKGKVIYRDTSRDLAILQLDKLPADTKALPLAKKSPATGEPVINIGNPGAVDWTFSTTQGNVRGVGVVDMVVGTGGGQVLRIKARMVSITNPINPGDSGGPLIDKHGYLVGVTESGRVGAQNVNNCVDVTEVRAFLNEKKIVVKDPKPEKDDSPPPKGPDGRPPRPRDPVPPAAEHEATQALQQAKLFQNDEDKSYYKAKLKQVVSKYPGTAAAKEAQKLLDAANK